MKRSIKKFINKIICGDALETLKKFPDESIDCVICSPPYYYLRNYQVKGQIGLEPTFEDYLNNLLKIFKEIKRVLKKEGSFWLNLGDVYCSHPAGNTYISEANRETDEVFVRKMKMNEGAKSFVNIGGFQGEQLKRNPQKRKSILIGKTKKQIGKLPDKCMMMLPERVALRMIDEQGWILRQKIIWSKQVLINKEKKTIGSVMPTSTKTRFNTSWEYLFHFVKNNKGKTGWYILGNEPNKEKFPEKHKIWEKVPDKFRKGIWRKEEIPKKFLSVFTELDYYFNLDEVRIPISPYSEKYLTQWEYRKSRWKREGQNPSQMQFGKNLVPGKEIRLNYFNYRVRDAKRKKGQPQFRASEEEIKKYQEKETKAKRIMKGEAGENIHHGVSQKANQLGLTSFQYSMLFSNPLGKNIPSVWLINPEKHNFQKELGIEVEHFAIYPELLVEIPIKVSCPPDGIVLDPFIGSGTTAIVAKKLGRNYIGIDINPKYVKIVKKRLKRIN